MDVNLLKMGQRRSFNFLEPYNNILSNKTIYEVTQKYTLQSMIDGGLDPLNQVYIKYGMTENDYVNDLASELSIVELTLGIKKYYIPADRIQSIGDETNIPYSERIIGVKIGFIPVGEDLTDVMNDIHELVADSLGIDSKVANEEVTVQLDLSLAEHDEQESKRAILRTDPSNYKKKYYKIKAELAYALDKLRALEEAELNSRL